MDEYPEVVVDINHLRHGQVFHYLPPASLMKLELGMRVLVPFGNKMVQGWVVGHSAPPPGVVLREIQSAIRLEPDFSAELLGLARWMADFYIHPLPEIFKLMSAPEKPLRTRKPAVSDQLMFTSRPRRVMLNSEQAAALEQIEQALDARAPATAGAARPPNGWARQYLLHGITGSGKTEVYLRAAMTAIAHGYQVLYLVPEIALTPQAGAWFKTTLGEQVALWHSRLARGEKYGIWEGIKQGRLNILIGPRSAVFAPFRDLGLIIIDEEHDPSYKQQESPYYHARQVAEQRAVYNTAVIVLGSATPSLESYTGAKEGKYRLLRLTRRPQGRKLPRITVVDLKSERDAGNFSLLGKYLTGQIANRLQRHEQVILFLNRRGYSPIVFCPLCGHVLKCDRCSISLVYHKAIGDMRCHYCNFKRLLPEACPGCGAQQSFRFLGMGIQRVEHMLQRMYPQARTQRLDFDTTRRKGAFDRILDSFGRREVDILLGTQMVTKGHDFPGVTLVGVLNADLALNLPDYRSAERTYQLLAQVAGRAGRGAIPGEVVVQTYFPEHYSIRAACLANYPAFYREEIRNRDFMGYPPFGELVRIRVYGEKEQQVATRITDLAEAIRSLFPDEQVKLLGPAPAPLLRLKDLYRWQFMLKGELGQARHKIRACTHRYQKNTSDIITIEVDPFGF